jgi:hypothetical protein
MNHLFWEGGLILLSLLGLLTCFLSLVLLPILVFSVLGWVPGLLSLVLLAFLVGGVVASFLR